LSMKLYGDPSILRTRKAFVFLQEKTLAFEFVPAKLLDLSSICSIGVFPGRVEPVLVDGETSVTGAMAICSYVDLKHASSPLIPRDPTTLMLAQYIEENFYAQLDDLILEISRHEAGEWYSRPEVAEGLVKGRLRSIMAFFEHMKAKARYLISDAICIADISVGLALMQMSKHAWIHTSGPYVDHSTFTKMSPDFPLMAQYCNEL
jgi:glutathione S-transferase